MKIEMLDRKHLACPSHAGLNLIGNEENAVLARNLFEARQELRRRNNVSTLALNCFDDDCRNFFGMNRGPEYNVLKIARIAVRNVRDAWNQRSESFPLDSLRRRQRQ